MPAIHTHYDNLKVARNAPPEVIRAAYKTLSQKYHPDRHNGDKRAAQVMAIINTSYEVLSDPAKRRAHDLWIAQQEALSSNQEPPRYTTQPPTTSQQQRRSVHAFLLHLARYWLLYGIGGLILWGALKEPSAPPPGPKPYTSTPPAAVTPTPVQKGCELPDSAPNGAAWPTNATYLAGQDVLHADGLSSVTIDNSQNDSDVFVKLVSISGQEAYPVRQIFIPAGRKFTAEQVDAGSYDVRYRDLTTGCLSRSDPFDLEETPEENGIRYSAITMTLYKVQNGNMQTFPLSEAEF